MPLPIVLAVTGASGSVYGLRLLSFLLDTGHQVELVYSDNAKLVAYHELGYDFRNTNKQEFKQQLIELIRQRMGIASPPTVARNDDKHVIARSEATWRSLHGGMGIASPPTVARNDDARGCARNDDTIENNLRIWDHSDVAASISSGSYKTQGMIIAPASMGTIANIAAGTSNNLIARAADVIIKERRKLVLVARETPLSTIHLRNMLTLSEMGAVVLPAAPGFYQHPKTIDDQVDFIVGKTLDAFGIEHELFMRWTNHGRCMHETSS